MNEEYIRNLDMFAELSEEERKLALQILDEYSTQGSSEKYDKLIYDDYKEIPVDIETFINDEMYLGKGLLNEEGKQTIFPYWVETLKKIFPDNLDPKFNTAIFTGAIGLGKSTIAVIGQLYQLYKTMCLKDPYQHYGIQSIDVISFAFVNITLDAAKGVAWSKCQQLLQRSPWFMARGRISGTVNPTWNPPDGIELIVGSQPRHFIGRALLGIFVDEVSFQPNQDIEKQKRKAMEIVSSANARMQSRFMRGEYKPYIMFLASSKRTEQSFLESYIEDKKKAESTTTLIVDEPQWVIRTDKDSKIKFKVALGNKFLDSEVVPLHATEEDLQQYRDRGYALLDVPIGYYENFLEDINIALTDIAGISTSGSMKYLSGPRIAKVFTDSFKNMFVRDVIEVGNSPDDKSQYWDFIDMSRVSPQVKSRPMYLHLDMSLSGDKTGLAGVCVIGKKPPQNDEVPARDMYFEVPFVVSVKAPKGYQVSFEKTRNFIRWLKKEGFNIKGISSDTFQSADLQQQLKAEGFNMSILSVDRVVNRICLPYKYLQSTIYEERIKLPHNTLLQEELLGLERDGNGKIDHPDGGKTGSKDSADAVTGALYNASLHAEEYAFEFGETLSTIVEVSEGADSPEAQMKQITVAFEQEMQKLLNPAIFSHDNNSQEKETSKQTVESLENSQKDGKILKDKEKSPFMDFGLGKAQKVNPMYMQNGILFW